MSSTACLYSARFSRLRQSSSVSFQDLSGSFSRRLKRFSCSSPEMCIQNLIRINPLVGQGALEAVDLVIGAQPLLPGREALHALDQHPAVPGAVEHRHPSPAGERQPEAPQEVMPLLVVGRRRELDDADVARIEFGDQAADRASLPGGVLALEDHADGWAELTLADQSAEREAELCQPLPRALEPLGLLLARKLQRQVEVVECAHDVRSRSAPCRCAWRSRAGAARSRPG